MKIDRIEYQKNYNIMGMQWEKIIAGGTLEDGDDFQSCVKKLRSECDQAAQSKIDSLYQETTPSIYNANYEFQTQAPKSRDEIYIQEIHNCKTTTDLDAWKFLAKSKPELENAYNNKLNELTND